MALTPTETSLCNKMLGDYAALMGPVKLGASGVTNQRSALMSKLGGMSYTTPSDLDNKLNIFKNAVGLALPDPNDLNSLKNMLTQCDYFKNLGPTAALAGLMQSALGNISSLISNMAAGTNEFGAGNIAGLINQALSNLIPGGSGLTDILKSAGSLLDCMSSVCVAGDPTYLGGLESMDNDLNSTIAGMGLVGDPSSIKFGTMDYDTIYNDLGMTPTQRYAIESTTFAIDEQRVRAQTAITDSIAAVKGKIGSIF